ncbi:MAG: AmmeMemoRadiSam system protein B [Planctomycetes bacterium]|nr:AmmeMemoRadiSam system protein B [Planctomycetota bacterium]
MEKPKIRPVSTMPVEVDGTAMIRLEDPRGIGRPVAVSPAALELIAHFFDGEHTVVDMQAEIVRATGAIVPSRTLQDLIDALDEALLLESERFQGHYREALELYRNAANRPAAHAGQAYPDDREELGTFLTSFLGEAVPEADGALARAFVAPHIDFARGAEVYGRVYREVAARGRADLYIILGTCHSAMEAPFAATRKAYETPLGVAEVDGEAVDTLVGACGEGILGDEWSHRGEHSIEFQVVCLQHVLGRPFRILPILCGGIPEPDSSEPPPRELDPVRRIVDGIRAVLAQNGRRIVLLAGVDFAHVGPQFGDPAQVDRAMLAAVEAADREALDAVTRVDAEGFYRSLASHGNRYRVCGYAPLYVLLEVLGRGEGELLGYRAAVHPRGFQAVTFAGVAID